MAQEIQWRPFTWDDGTRVWFSDCGRYHIRAVGDYYQVKSHAWNGAIRHMEDTDWPTLAEAKQRAFEEAVRIGERRNESSTLQA